MFIFSFRFCPIFLSFSQLFSLSVFFSSFLLLSYRSLLPYNILKYFFFCLPMFCSVWCSCLSVIYSFCDILLILLCYVLNFYLPHPTAHRKSQPQYPLVPFFHCLHLYDYPYVTPLHYTTLYLFLAIFTFPSFFMLSFTLEIKI